jgi:hypothetical protein
MRFPGSTGSAVGVSSSLGILRGSLYTSSATDACRSFLKAVQIPRRIREAPCPLLVCVAHDDCLQCSVEAFHESVSRGVMGSLPQELNATQLSQRLEKLRFEVTSLVGGDGLWTTEAGYPAGQQGACHGVGCDVRDGDDFWPAGEAVYSSEAVHVARRRRRGPTRPTRTCRKRAASSVNSPNGVSVW